MSDRRGGVERIDHLITSALPDRVREGLAGWQAVAAWSAICGEEAARRSAAVAFRDGRLIVEVVNSVWMCQLDASQRALLRRLDEELGGPVVTELSFRLNPSLDPGVAPNTAGG